MPAKELVKHALASLPGEPLSSRVDSIRVMFLPEKVSPETLVRNYDVTDALIPILDASKPPQRAGEIGSAKKTMQDGDVAISRLRAYLKETAVVRTNRDHLPCVGSSEFIVLRAKPGRVDISAETLMVFLRSSPVHTILKWCQDGSQHPRFSEDDLLSISVPHAVAQCSMEVTRIVREAFAAREMAMRRLDSATRGVELAIEKGEGLALDFLRSAQRGN
jgi:hypothetical protein